MKRKLEQTNISETEETSNPTKKKKRDKFTAYFSSTVVRKNHHEPHVKRHEKVILPNNSTYSPVNCAYSFSNKVYTSVGVKIIYVGTKKTPYAGEQYICLGNFVKKHPLEICSICYYSCKKTNKITAENNKNELEMTKKLKSEQMRLENFGMEIFVKKQSITRSNDSIECISSILKPAQNPLKKVVLCYNEELNNLINETCTGCIICSNGSKIVLWKFVEENLDGKNGIVITKTFDCGTGIHRMIWFNREIIAKHIFAAVYVEALVEKKMTRVLEKLKIRFNVYRPHWKKKIWKYVHKESEISLEISRVIINTKYSNKNFNLIARTDVQWKTKQLREKRAKSAHGTFILGDEMVITDSEVCHNTDIINDDGVFYRTLPPVTGLSFPRMEKISTYLSVYEEIYGKAISYKNYDVDWMKKVEKHGKMVLEKRKLEREKKNKERKKFLKEKYNLIDELTKNFLEDAKSIEMEYFLRLYELKVSGTLVERKARLEKFLEDQKESDIMQDFEEEQQPICRCLEKLISYILFSRYPEFIKVPPKALALDGCKQSQAAGNTFFVAHSPGCVISLDVFHGSGTYSKKWNDIVERNPIFCDFRFFYFFEQIEIVSEIARKKNTYEKQIKCMKEGIMEIGDKIEKIINFEEAKKIINEKIDTETIKFKWTEENKETIRQYIQKSFQPIEISKLSETLTLKNKLIKKFDRKSIFPGDITTISERGFKMVFGKIYKEEITKKEELEREKKKRRKKKKRKKKKKKKKKATEIIEKVENKEYVVKDLIEEAKKDLNGFLLFISERGQLFLFFAQTSEVESFHQVCNQYYKKGLHSSDYEYEARIKLAICHWNYLKFRNLGIIDYDWKSSIISNFLSSY